MSITFNINTYNNISTIVEILSKIILSHYFKLSILFLIVINNNSDPNLSISIGALYLLILRTIAYSKRHNTKIKKN